MKKIKFSRIAYVIVLTFFLASFVHSAYTDVIYLNNGSVIRGVILENEINKQVKIETANKSVIIVKYSEIKTIKKEKDDKSTDFSQEAPPPKPKKEKRKAKKSESSKVVELIINPKLGVNASTFKGDKFGNDSGYIANFIGGMDFQFVLFKYFAVIPGIYFSMQGVKYTDDNNLFFEIGELIGNPASSSSEVKERLSYFNFFLPLGYRLKLNSIFSATFFVGPVWSWLISGSRKFGDVVDSDSKESVTSEYKDSDIGLTVGTVLLVGVKPNSKFGFSLDIRYTMGFKNINANSIDPRTLNNRYFSFMLGIAFSGI